MYQKTQCLLFCSFKSTGLFILCEHSKKKKKINILNAFQTVHKVLSKKAISTSQFSLLNSTPIVLLKTTYHLNIVLTPQAVKVFYHEYSALSSVSKNSHQDLCTFFQYVFQNREIKVNAFQNEVMHSSKIVSIADFLFQIKIEEQNLFYCKKIFSVRSFLRQKRQKFCLSKLLKTDIWLHRESQMLEKDQFR